MAGLFPGSLAWASTDQYAQRIEYDANNLPIYIGECHPKNQHRTGADVWRIKYITYDANMNALTITWANRSKDFRFSWDSRAIYNYA